MTEIIFEDNSDDVDVGPFLPNSNVRFFERKSRQNELETTLSRNVFDSFTPVEDEDYVRFEIDGNIIFRGVLRSIDRSTAAEVQVRVDSFERLAQEAEPTGGNETFTGVDDTSVITTAIDNVSDLSQGTIENVKSGLTFSFNFVTRARQIRIVRSATNGIIRYNPDLTVDYLASVGSDRTSETISPQNETVEDISVRKAGGSKTFNKALVLGGGGGDAKTVVNVTATNYDPTTERERWTVISNKDLSDSDTLREYGEEVIDEMYEDHIEIRATVRDVDVNLGDEFNIVYNRKDIDRNLKAQSVENVYSPLGKYQIVEFKTTQLARLDRFDEISEDVERFNRESGERVVATFDDPSFASQEEGNIVYVTGENSNYPRGIYYHNGGNFELTMRGDVDTKNVFIDSSLVVPTGSPSADGAVLPVGTDRFKTS